MKSNQPTVQDITTNFLNDAMTRVLFTPQANDMLRAMNPREECLVLHWFATGAEIAVALQDAAEKPGDAGVDIRMNMVVMKFAEVEPTANAETIEIIRKVKEGGTALVIAETNDGQRRLRQLKMKRPN